MKRKFLCLVVFFLAIFLTNGCGSSSSGGGGTTTTGVGGGVSSAVLGSGNGTVGLFAQSDNKSISSSISANGKSIQKEVSYEGGTVTKFDVEIKKITFKQSGGTDVPLDVNETVHIANPDYASTVNFLASLTVPAGNYTGFDCELGTVTFASTGISPDPKSAVEAFSNQIVSVDLNFSVATGGELAMPLILDLDTILQQGFEMSAATPFAIRVTVLPLMDGSGAVWTTGDMLGFASMAVNGVGDLYEISDANMATNVGTYTQSSPSATTGTYVFTGGTYAGIRGTYVINPGGTFAGGSNGFFALNGNYDGGYWINDVGYYGTFSLTDGWIPNGTGTFEGTNFPVVGTITLSSDAMGGTWEVTSGIPQEAGDVEGTFSL